MAEPPGGFDPEGWPVAERAALPDGCWVPAPGAPGGPLRAIPRCHVDSKAARTLMEQRKPVVLTSSKLVGTAAGKWDLEYLRANLRGLPLTVFASPTRHFRYWDDAKNDAGYATVGAGRTAKQTMGIDDFCEAVRRDAAGSATRYYLQTSLVEGVGASLASDFKAFDWSWLLATQRRLGWSELTSNLLLVGQRGNVTPAHYDEQENIFAQLAGRKRVVLFSPRDFGCLYPFPLHHPNDRQAQVDFDAPDASRFPRFGEARGFEATLSAGELLYIPQYWFHHVENLDDACVSLNFWFRHQSVPSAISLPLSPDQHLAMRRNVERHVADKLGARRAQADLPLISRAQPPAELAALRAEVCKLLAHVMGSREEVDAWLSELVAGRFELGHELGAADADATRPAVEVV